MEKTSSRISNKSETSTSKIIISENQSDGTNQNQEVPSAPPPQSDTNTTELIKMHVPNSDFPKADDKPNESPQAEKKVNMTIENTKNISISPCDEVIEYDNEAVVIEEENISMQFHSEKAKEISKPIEQFTVAEMFKNVPFALNLFYIVSGLVVVCIGTWLVLSTVLRMENILGIYFFFILSVSMVCFGLFLIIAAGIGCVSVYNRSKLLSILHLIFLYICFVIFIVEGIVAFLVTDKVNMSIMNSLEIGVLYFDINTGHRSNWNYVQKEFKCCGMEKVTKNGTISGWKIFQNRNGKFFSSTNRIPSSCCRGEDIKDEKERCQKNPNEENAYINKTFGLIYFGSNLYEKRN